MSKIVKFIEDSYSAYQVDKITVTNLKGNNFFNLPTVQGDIAALEIVFRNLAENSMKYCKRDRNCLIELEWEQDDDYLIINFIDYGIGISEKDADNIFIEGYRTEEAVRRNPAGTGIGLSQTKEIMEKLGGELFLRIHKEKTIFVIKLKKWKGGKKGHLYNR